MMAEWMTLKEVAARAGVTVWTVRRWIYEDHLLKAHRLGGDRCVRISEKDWQDFIKASEIESEEPSERLKDFIN